MGHSTVLIPKEIAFEVPRDYATHCGGQIVHIAENNMHEEGLGIAWDDQWISFSFGRHIVEYRRDAVKCISLNAQEHIMTWVICTIRVVFVGRDGTLGSLVLLDCDGQYHNSMENVFRDIASCGLPVATERNPRPRSPFPA